MTIDTQGRNIVNGMKLIYTLQPGEQYAIYRGSIIVVHPDRPPKIVTQDGIYSLELRG